jgi:hypothetical protein
MPQIGKQLDGMAWIRKNEGKGIRVVVQQICSWVTVAAVVTHWYRARGCRDRRYEKVHAH